MSDDLTRIVEEMKIRGEYNEVRHLLRLLHPLPKSKYLEIGVPFGGFFTALLGLHKPDEVLVGLAEPREMDQRVETLKRAGLNATALPVQEEDNSYEKAEKLLGAELDLLMIEGTRRRELVKTDLQFYWPLLKPSGVCVIRGIRREPVRRLWKDMTVKYAHTYLEHYKVCERRKRRYTGGGPGIGVLWKITGERK